MHIHLVDLYTCISKFKVHINADALDVLLISKAPLSWRIFKQLNYLNGFVFSTVLTLSPFQLIKRAQEMGQQDPNRAARWGPL